MAVDTILETLLGNIDDEYQKTVGYPTYDILAAFAVVMDDLQTLLEETEEKLDPAQLSGDDLARYVYQRRGIVAKAATCAEAVLTVTGTGTISRGDVFETDGGLQFEADSGQEIDGSGEVPVTCVTAGSVGNVSAGTITHMPVTIQGIASCTNAEPADGGYDAESDADLLDRYYTSLQEPAVSGNAAHYKQWALEVAGVSMAQVYPLARGENTVEVMILDEDGQPASESLIANVQEYIDPDSAGLGEGQAPIGAHCYVTAPDTLAVNLALTVTADEDFEQDVILESIREQVGVYLSDICLAQDYVSYGKVCAYISAADGVLDFSGLTINDAAESLTIPEKTVAVLGEVTITYA